MFRIEEASLAKAMDYTINTLFEGNEYAEFRNIIAYSPTYGKNNKEYLKDNPTTGKIFLKDYPDAMEAWVLVKFLNTNKEPVSQNRFTEYKTLRTEKDFEDFWGVIPTKNYSQDMIINVSWNKQEVENEKPNRDFDETTPNFYMYSTHRKIGRKELAQKLIKTQDILDSKNGKLSNGLIY